MNNDWTTCKIGDICKKICSGGTPKVMNRHTMVEIFRG